MPGSWSTRFSPTRSIPRPSVRASPAPSTPRACATSHRRASLRYLCSLDVLTPGFLIVPCPFLTNRWEKTWDYKFSTMSS